MSAIDAAPSSSCIQSQLLFGSDWPALTEADVERLTQTLLDNPRRTPHARMRRSSIQPPIASAVVNAA
jgi:hypothetical protein